RQHYDSFPGHALPSLVLPLARGEGWRKLARTRGDGLKAARARCSAAVIEATLLERQRLGLALEMAFGDLADDHAVVAQLVKPDDLALDRRRRVADDRRAIFARLEGVVA